MKDNAEAQYLTTSQNFSLPFGLNKRNDMTEPKKSNSISTSIPLMGQLSYC
jgi:hypothetical protein